jgi:hypothetical protein
MLQTVKKLLQRVFHQSTGFDAFIASKNPKNASDVEHWMRIYQRNGDRHGY